MKQRQNNVVAFVGIRRVFMGSCFYSVGVLLFWVMVLQLVPFANGASFTDDFNRSETGMSIGNPKSVWFSSDIGNGWEEYCAGNSDSGDAGYASDIWLSGSRVKFCRVGWGPDATCYLRRTVPASMPVTGVKADLELDPWMDGYFQDNSYVGVFMWNSTSNAHVWVVLDAAVNTSNERKVRLKYTKSSNGNWTGWSTAYEIGSAEQGLELGSVTVTANLIDPNDSSDFKLVISVEKDGQVLGSWETDWYDTVTSFDSVRLSGNWDAWAGSTGGWAYMYADNIKINPAASFPSLFSDCNAIWDYGYSDIISDLSQNCYLDLTDFSIFAQGWLAAEPENSLLINGSFELPVRPTRITSALPSNWSLVNFGVSKVYAHGPDTYHQITPKDGNQWFVMRACGILQTTNTKFIEGVTYTLTAFAASESQKAGGFEILIYAADTPTATTRGTYLADTWWTPPVYTSGWGGAYSVSYTATSAVAGKYVQAVVYSDPGVNDTIWVDDVILTVNGACDSEITGDFNRDCIVDFSDLLQLSDNWLRCNDPLNANCAQTVPFPGTIFSIDNVRDQEGISQPLLFDGTVQTGNYVQRGSYTIQRSLNDEIIWVALHINARYGGSFTVEANDVMPVNVVYTAGERWYQQRFPHSTAAQLVIKWLGNEAKLNEVQLLGRSTLPSHLGTGTENVSVSVALSGVGTSPMCRVPLGMLAAWSSHGVADAMTVPATKSELIQRLNELGVKALRYPGGSYAYAYPPTQAALTVYASDPNIYRWNNALNHQDYWGWSSAEDFLNFCRDANIIAWYQIDPGYWFDTYNNKVHQIISMDNNSGYQLSWLPDDYTGDYVSQAVISIQNYALLAESKGVQVIWEIGNEDFEKFEPQTYSMLCNAFMQGIWSVVPNAQFAVCGDSYSWSDWSWANSLVADLDTTGVPQIAFSSNHLYLSGSQSYDSPEVIGNWIISQWNTLRYMYFNQLTSNFYARGYTDTKMALTEFNAFHSPTPETTYGVVDGAQLEHCVARALAEAYIIPDMYRYNVSALFLHDLVRNDPCSVYFARLDYYPQNPEGKRYHWYPEGPAASIVSLHGNGRIAYGELAYNNGVWVSRQSGFVYITVVNRGANYKDMNLTLQGVTIDNTKMMDMQRFRAASENSSCFDFYLDSQQITAPLSGSGVLFEVPPYSVVGLKVYVH